MSSAQSTAVPWQVAEIVVLTSAQRLSSFRKMEAVENVMSGCTHLKMEEHV